MEWIETPTERARAFAEQAVVIPGEHGKLFGIVTPPALEGSPSELCVILLGRNRWFGDRLGVKSARWLAARGFWCLRFDYHGYGESEGDSETIDPDRPYREDTVAAIRYMRIKFGQTRFALSGFCFDGRTAMSAVAQEGDSIETIVVFAALPGEMASLNAHPEKAGRGITDSNTVVRVTDGFMREVHALVRWKIRCLFLYGTDDIEYHNFKLVERSLLEKLQPDERARITVDVWPGRVHVAEDPDLMREITERGLWWIDSFREKPFTLAQSGAPYGLRT
jgi:alpha/beta superfamily hydrolase